MQRIGFKVFGPFIGDNALPGIVLRLGGKFKPRALESGLAGGF
jgi:hypothetical protein